MHRDRRLYSVGGLFTVFLFGAVLQAAHHGSRAVDLVAACASAGGLGVVAGLIAAARRLGGSGSG
jgi:hypothetical protein